MIKGLSGKVFSLSHDDRKTLLSVVTNGCLETTWVIILILSAGHSHLKYEWHEIVENVPKTSTNEQSNVNPSFMECCPVKRRHHIRTFPFYIARRQYIGVAFLVDSPHHNWTHSTIYYFILAGVAWSNPPEKSRRCSGVKLVPGLFRRWN